MTKIINKINAIDMQTHIKNSFDFIEQYLPDMYVQLVQEKMKELKMTNVSPAVIRNVKAKGPNLCKNIPVLAALLAVAQDSKKANEAFIEISSSLHKINPDD